MLDIAKFNCFLSMPGASTTGQRGPQREALVGLESPALSAAAKRKPVVTWRVTRSCNLNCARCVSNARPRPYGGELTTAEGKALIRDLAVFEVPRLVFAGGEPLLRPDLVELVAYAHEQGIRTGLCTNGTLLSRDLAAELVDASLDSLTIMLEGIGHEMDRQRGQRGAFDATMEGYANAEAAGLAVEMRLPLHRGNYLRLSGILDFIERRRIRRVVFAHMVYAGRGNDPQGDLTHEEKRHALDMMMERSEDFHRRGVAINLATDENHVDGIYLHLRLAQRNPRRAAAAYQWLPRGAASVQGAGVGVAGVDSMGGVHPDPYWATYDLGNVRRRPFSAIWEKSPDPLLRGLRNRLPLLKGRCADCRWQRSCGGNLRVRAEKIFGDPWMTDPACYLSDREIGKEVTKPAEIMEGDVLLLEQAA